MGQLMLVDSEKLDAALTAVAEAIRAKSGSEEQLAFPDGFTEAIANLGEADAGEVDAMELYLTDQLIDYTSDVIGTLKTYAMRYCKNLRSVIFNKATAPGGYMFQTCSSLESASFPEATAVSNGTFFDCFSLTEVYMPKIQSIGTQAFYGCKALTALDACGTKSILASVFVNCEGLVTLILRSTTVCTLGNVNTFTGTPMEDGTGYIYVPSALVEEYKAATNWSTFADQFRAIEDYPDICGGAAE